MIDTILKWWTRKWSNWEFDGEIEVYDKDEDKYPARKFARFKSVSNDGLARYKRIRK